MNMGMLLLLLLAAASLVAGQVQLPKKINVLRPQSSAAGEPSGELMNCLSWRLAVETHNIFGFGKPPDQCFDYLKDYILDRQYSADIDMEVNEAIDYVSNLTLPKGLANLWVFDIDETALSNVDHFINKTISEPRDLFSPAIPQTLKLYNKVLSVGIDVVFLTGREEKYRNMTEYNLKKVGYDTWFKLILKSDIFANETAKSYKSTIRAELEKEGYRIVGNIGDQWSDISGTSPGLRVFKMPNPFYYIP